MDEVLSVRQVSDELHIPERTLYYLIKNDRGPKTYKFSRHIRILRNDLNDWIREQIQEKNRTATWQGDRSDINPRSKETNNDKNNI
jgi:predicted DNA-binding transcriptional regulator AlpA